LIAADEQTLVYIGLYSTTVCDKINLYRFTRDGVSMNVAYFCDSCASVGLIAFIDLIIDVKSYVTCSERRRSVNLLSFVVID